MTAPLAPSGLTVTPIAINQLDLDWTDNSSNEDGFAIERSNDGVTGWVQLDTVAANVTNWSNTALLGYNVTYFYRVRAFNSDGFSSYTSVESGATGLSDDLALTAATVDDGRIDLAWNAVADQGAYQVERSPNGTTSWSIIATVGIGTTSYSNDGGLSPLTTYYYRVTALNMGGGHSDYSNVASAKTLGAPTGLTLTILSAYRAKLDWTDTNTGELGYKIERSVGGLGGWEQVASVAANTITWTNYGLRPAHHYYYRIRAFTARGYGSYSSVVDDYTETAPPSDPSAISLMRLFLLKPTVVFEARVNMASVTYPLDEVVFDTVTTGAYGDIKPGMTVIIGSASGLDNHGRNRIRKAATSTKIYVGRSSQGNHDGEFNISDNDYIRVLDLYQVWAKIPYIAADGTIYKDSDLVVSDNTDQLPPVANAGIGYAGTILPGLDYIHVYFDGSNSFSPLGLTFTYQWDIADGTIVSVGDDATSIHFTATFPAGFRYVSLTVTDSNGKSHTARCPILARDPTPGSDTTLAGFQIDSHKISLTGQELSFRTLQSISATDYPDGTLCMIWDREPADEFDRDHMYFTGWLHTEPATIEAQRTGTLKGTVLNALDVGGKLNTLPGFPLQVEDDARRPTTGPGALPDITWSYMTDLNLDKYLHYLLHWHSTALEVADFFWSGTTTTFTVDILSSDGQSLWAQVEQRAAALTPDYHLTCSRHGQIRVLPDPMIQETGSRTSTVQAALDASDWASLAWTHQRPPRVYWLYGSAIATTPYPTIFAARVNQASFTYPISQVTYDTVTTGAYGDVLVGQTLLFGTTAGAKDHGETVVDKPLTSTLVYTPGNTRGTAEGELQLADNDYITVQARAYFCRAPGDAAGQGVQTQELGERLATSQDALNRAIGHHYQRLNAIDSTFAITLAYSDDLDIDPSDLTWVTLTLPADLAAQRGGQLSAARGLVNEMNIRYDYQRTGLVRTVELVWEREVIGPAAITQGAF